MILSEFIKKLQELEAAGKGDLVVQSLAECGDSSESWTEWQVADDPYLDHEKLDPHSKVRRIEVVRISA